MPVDRVEDFVIRHNTLPGQSQADAVKELAAIKTDLLIMESQYNFSGDSKDTPYTAQEIATIKAGGDGGPAKTVLGYMSVGSIQVDREISASFASVLQSGTGEVTLRFWEKENGTYKILAPLTQWALELKAQGFDGVYLDVLNSYFNDGVWPLISSNKADAYVIATTSLMEIITALDKALNDTPGVPQFQIALGNNPDLIQHNYNPAGLGDPPATVGMLDVERIADFQKVAEYFVVESLPIAATTHLTKPAIGFRFNDTKLDTSERILGNLGISITPGGTAPGKTFAFGDAQVLDISYFNGDGVFADGTDATWQALSLQIQLGRLGVISYATPTFKPLGLEDIAKGTNTDTLDQTQMVFNLPDEKPNALLADLAGSLLDGMGGTDYVSGRAGNDTLRGGAGDDLIEGDAGNDVLEGGAGADVMAGGTGDDTYGVDASDVIFEYAGEGNDLAVATATYRLAAGVSVETLQLATSTAAGRFTLTGNELANTLRGNRGNNILDGGAGVDTLIGRDGNDTYGVDNPGDQVIELVGGGADVVVAATHYTLAAGQEIETLQAAQSTGRAAIRLTGNEFDNVIRGNGGNNVLDGRGGIDTLVGRGGNDTYAVDNAADKVIELAGEGNDTIVTTTSYALAPGQEIEALRVQSSVRQGSYALTGNEFGNTLGGSNLPDVLNGGGGADILIGKNGADTLSVGDDDAVDIVTIQFGPYSTIKPSPEPAGGYDRVIGMDLDAEDKFDISLALGIDPPPIVVAQTIAAGPLNAGTLQSDLNAVVAPYLKADGGVTAVLVDPTGGDLDVDGHLYLAIDVDRGGYLPGFFDIVVELIDSSGTLDATDFI